jgi:Trypsin-like peptidase domain
MTRIILAALFVLSLSAVVSAQPISVDREKVLGSFGRVFDENKSIAPTRNGPGTVFTEEVTQPNVTSMRLRFKVVDRGQAGLWTVVVTAGNRRWEHAPAAGETEFWSDEMPGASVFVTVVSTVAQPRMKLTIDRIAGGTQPAVPKSITLPDERDPWNAVQEPFTTLGRSVVRLRFVDDVKKKVFVCTGWLVFDSLHVLTNDHCINSEPERESALADIDFDQGTVPARSVRFRRLLMSDERLDFSLLELEDPIHRPALGLGGSIAANQQLAIIQHPAGEPKQLSERGCTVAQASVAGVTADPTDFEHRCDTLGGSSGSPVLDRTSLNVVGLHHLGFLEGDKPVNRAVLIADVLAKIRTQFPDLGRPVTP